MNDRLDITRKEAIELLKEKKEARAIRNAMNSLKTAGGWTKLVSIMEKQAQAKEQQALYGDCGDRERAMIAGEAAGIRQFMLMPQILLDASHDIVFDED